MSETIAGYRCSKCGAVFSGAGDLSNHLRTRENVELQPERTSESRRDLASAYAHADREFSRARIPIVGAMVALLFAFVYALAFGVGIFVRLFVAATTVTVGFLVQIPY